MDLVFKHLEHRCEQGQLLEAWATLLHTFGQSILDTHRSKFTQYLLWYLCRQASCSAAFDDRSDRSFPSFADWCIAILCPLLSVQRVEEGLACSRNFRRHPQCLQPGAIHTAQSVWRSVANVAWSDSKNLHRHVLW